MIHWKRLIVILLAAFMVFSLGACGTGDPNTGRESERSSKEKQKGNMNTEGSMGRYVENEMTLPEGNYRIMEALTDGRLRILTDTGVYDSKDQGATWQLWEAQPEDLVKDLKAETEKAEGSTIMAANAIQGPVIGKDGALFYHIKQDGARLFKYINPEGMVSQFYLEMSEEIMNVKLFGAGFTDAGDVLYVDELGNIYLIDCKTGALKHEFKAESESGIANVFSVGDQLFRVNSNYKIGEDGMIDGGHLSIKYFSLSSYEQIEVNNSLSEFINSGAGLEGDDLFIEFFKIPGSESFYIANTSGIYRYKLDSSVVEKVFDGNMGEMNSAFIQEGAVVDQDHFYISYVGTENRLVKYVFDPNMLSVPELKLTVYSLYDNFRIREAITKFQKLNPDVHVSYDVGLYGEDGMTESDAIKSVNTNIMAGEGPDILIMDGLPLKSYQEKGMLQDISDVINEVSKESGLFENIAGTYEKDGKIQAVPTGFSVPVIMGKKDSIARATDLEGYIGLQEELKNNGGTSNLSNMETQDMMKIFMTTSSTAWMKQDGTLDEIKLKEFITDMQKLADISQIPAEKRSDMSREDGVEFEMTQFMTTGELYIGDMLNSKTDLNVFQMKDIANLYQVTSAMKQIGEEYGYQAAPGQSTGTYVPLLPVGISSKSENGETAKRLIRFLIGPEGNLLTGWPINKKMFTSKMTKPDNLEEGKSKGESQNGEIYEYTKVWPSQEIFQAFEKFAESLETPSVTDEIINKTVLEECGKCLKGEITVNEAVGNIISKINLYLSE